MNALEQMTVSWKDHAHIERERESNRKAESKYNLLDLV